MKQADGTRAATDAAGASEEAAAVSSTDVSESKLTPKSNTTTTTTKKTQEESAWLPSRIFFFWARPLFKRAAQLKKEGRALEHEDLLDLPQVDHSRNIGPAFQQAWHSTHHSPQSSSASPPLPKEGKGSAASTTTASPNANRPPIGAGLAESEFDSTKLVRKAIFHVIGRRMVQAGFVKVLNTGLQFTFPLLLNAILSFIEDVQRGDITDNDPPLVRYRGYWMTCALFAAMSAKAVTENSYFHLVYRCGYQARTAVSVAVYQKAMDLANAERQGTTLGELVNLMQVDATKLEMFVPQIHVLWDGLLQITGYIVILYTLIGWPCFVGLVVMVVAGPVQGIIMKKLFARNRAMVQHTDNRVKKVNEALQGIQTLKMFAWEDRMAQSIGASRNLELDNLRGVAYLTGFSRAYMGALPGIVAVTSFVVFALARSGSEIAASTLFAALSAFDQLRFPLLFYPMALAQYSQAKISARRVETFMNMREIGQLQNVNHSDHHNINNNNDSSDTTETATPAGRYQRDTDSANGVISLSKANIYWKDPDVPLADDDDNNSVKSSSMGTTKSDDASSADDDNIETPQHRYPKAILEGVSFTVNQGELCAVIGRVGSGKSTLCSAVLGETILQSGDVSLRGGKVAYVSQTAWILNATLRDNILFGMPYDAAKYRNVIDACQLTHDLEMLDNGDMTEIGERGINLSGGQKQRVSVARAAYAEADVIIFDDPLSALDPEVGRKLFDECIVGLLKGKTILFATNQLQFLQYCDTVVALGKRKVLEHGTFADLKASEGGEVGRLLDELKKATEKEKQESEEASSKLEGKETTSPAEISKEVGDNKEKSRDKGDAGLTTKEERQVGAVSWSVYKRYLQAGGGFWKVLCVAVPFVLGTANSLATSAWVSIWTSDPTYENNSEAFYLGIYAFLAVSLGVATFFRSFYITRFGVSASEKLHADLLKSILNAPQEFFDTTPLGRILSRFSKDMYSIDNELVTQMDFVIFMALSVVVSLGTIIFVTPWFGIAILPLGFVYFRILNYFRDVARETKRLDSISRSPVYAHFSETLGGLSTIRAYGEPQRFTEEFEQKVDQNTRAYYSNKAADRWLSCRLELIGATIAGLASVFAVNVAIGDGVTVQGSTSNFASLAGLSLTFAISMTSLLNWVIRSFSQLEASMTATERIIHFSENITQEAPRTADELKKAAASCSQDLSELPPALVAVSKAGGNVDSVAEDWPDKGEIVLNKLKMRYRSDTPLVLRGLDLVIHGGERIGVVGRTGSGKSSLLLTLLRLVEPQVDQSGTYEAPLKIDGVDTMRIGLNELRSRLGIIPQNPVLFSGTIKSNIDPFDEYTDDEIWNALARCGMKESVEAMPGALEATVAEYGENLSAGMRQMLVLGRALLKKCKILLLDEATSSVDYETDREIQKTLREEFAGCTILTIAHRINTILDSDKILVMKDGLVEEFAPPQELLRDEGSTFSEIVRQAESEQH